MRKTVKFSLLFLRHSFYFFHSIKTLAFSHGKQLQKFHSNVKKPRLRRQISLSPKPGYKIILRFKTCVKERRFDTT